MRLAARAAIAEAAIRTTVAVELVGAAEFTEEALQRVVVGQFVKAAATELEGIQRELFEEARERRDANIRSDIKTMGELAQFYSEDAKFPGWVELAWSRPEGAELDAVAERLKALKLTIRNTPVDGAPVSGTCPFTGKPAIERIYVARAY